MIIQTTPEQDPIDMETPAPSEAGTNNKRRIMRANRTANLEEENLIRSLSRNYLGLSMILLIVIIFNQVRQKRGCLNHNLA